MPHKPIDQMSLKESEWVADLSDSCLQIAVYEALVARQAATDNGADPNGKDQCSAALRAGDETLRTVKDGRARGDKACLKAATAIRKYTSALECQAPTAVRGRKGSRPLNG